MLDYIFGFLFFYLDRCFLLCLRKWPLGLQNGVARNYVIMVVWQNEGCYVRYSSVSMGRCLFGRKWGVFLGIYAAVGILGNYRRKLKLNGSLGVRVFFGIFENLVVLENHAE